MTRLHRAAAWLSLAAASLPGSGWAEGGQRPDPPLPTGHAHTLFDQTPPEGMRELATDRPDQTESPYTVDAGHFQIEMDLVTAAFDRSGSGWQAGAWSVAPMNLKVGLLDDVDLQVVVEPRVGVRTIGATTVPAPSATGFGDVATRLKWNVRGNDGGRLALALMPWVKWPLPASATRNGRTEGGIIVPLAVELAESWDLGAMTEVDAMADGPDRYAALWVNTVTVGHRLTRRLGAYVEAVAAVAAGRRWQGQIDAGATLAVGPSFQLDCGVNVGVAGAAPAFTPFTGLSVRF